VLFALAVAANLVLLYWPRTVGAGGPPHLDKAVHLLAFAAVAWTGLRAGLPSAVLLPVLVVHAVSSELVQARLLSERSGDPADVLADCAGVLLGALAGNRLGKASWRDEPAGPPRRGS
jgi:hypothetical protein